MTATNWNISAQSEILDKDVLTIRSALKCCSSFSSVACVHTLMYDPLTLLRVVQMTRFVGYIHTLPPLDSYDYEGTLFHGAKPTFPYFDYQTSMEKFKFKF